jgi:hypothetical protein
VAYSDAEVTEALILLAVNKYDFKKTSEQYGVTVKTLRAWEKKYPKKGVPELLERAIERMLMHIPSDMKGNDWAIALGILMDKWLLVHGKATSRAETLTRFLDDMPEDDQERIIREAESILAGADRGGDSDSDTQNK